MSNFLSPFVVISMFLHLADAVLVNLLDWCILQTPVYESYIQPRHLLKGLGLTHSAKFSHSFLPYFFLNVQIVLVSVTSSSQFKGTPSRMLLHPCQLSGVETLSVEIFITLSNLKAKGKPHVFI